MLLIDFEALDNKPTAAALGLAAVHFDIMEEDNFEELVNSDRVFFVKFAIRQQIKDGRSVGQDTLKWWNCQSEDAKKILKPSPDDVTVKEGLELFEEFCNKHIKDYRHEQVFCRGQSYDFPILASLVDRYASHLHVEGYSNFPGMFWNQNDVRTALRYMLLQPELRKIPIHKDKLKGFVKHNPIHDVCKDVIILQTAMRYAAGEDLPEKDYILV